MTEVFPKLGGLPQPVIDQMLKKANDGMLLYSPIHKIGEEKAGRYYCLRCGSHGEIIGDNIMRRIYCSNQMNMTAKMNKGSTPLPYSFCAYWKQNVYL